MQRSSQATGSADPAPKFLIFAHHRCMLHTCGAGAVALLASGTPLWQSPCRLTIVAQLPCSPADRSHAVLVRVRACVLACDNAFVSARVFVRVRARVRV